MRSPRPASWLAVRCFGAAVPGAGVPAAQRGWAEDERDARGPHAGAGLPLGKLNGPLRASPGFWRRKHLNNIASTSLLKVGL